MLCRQRITVVVPARNEARLIGRVLTTMPPFVDEVVVVDDGSEDDTAKAAQRHGDHRLQLVRHGVPLGVGAALRSGYHAAFSRGADVVAVMAGDAQMAPEDLRGVLAPVLEGRVGYAKGNRFTHPAVRHMPVLRRWGSRALSAATRVVTGLPVDDTQCGYTAMSRSAHGRVPWSRVWSGYGYPNDLLAWFALQDVGVCDVTVRPVYGDETSGLRWRHATLTIPLLLVRAGLRRLTRFLGPPRARSLRATPIGDRESAISRTWTE